MRLGTVFLYTCIGILQNGISDAFPSTTPMQPSHKQPQKYYAKIAELINLINHMYSNIKTVSNIPINKKQKRKFSKEEEILEVRSKKHNKERELLKTVMNLLQKNYDAEQEFGQKQNVRVHYIKNPEVLKQYNQNFRTPLPSSSSESAAEDSSDRKLKDIVRRNSMHFRLSEDSSSDVIVGDPDEVTAIRNLTKSVEEGTTFEFPHDETRNFKVNDKKTDVLEADELKDDVILVDDDLKVDDVVVDEETTKVIEDGEVAQDAGTWDVITKNYKWDDEAMTEKSLENSNLENANRRETKDSREGKKDNNENLINTNSDDPKDMNQKELNTDKENNLIKKTKDLDMKAKMNEEYSSSYKKIKKGGNNRYNKVTNRDTKEISSNIEHDWNKEENNWEKEETKSKVYKKYWSRDNSWEENETNSQEREDSHNTKQTKKARDREIKDTMGDRHNNNDNKKDDRNEKKDSQNNWYKTNDSDKKDNYYDKLNKKSKNRNKISTNHIPSKGVHNDKGSSWRVKKRKNRDYSEETVKEETKSFKSFERTERDEYRPKNSKKKTNNWDSYKPTYDDYYRHRPKRVDVIGHRLPPPIGGHAFGRTPIPIVGKKRIYDK